MLRVRDEAIWGRGAQSEADGELGAGKMGGGDEYINFA